RGQPPRPPHVPDRHVADLGGRTAAAARGRAGGRERDQDLGGRAPARRGRGARRAGRRAADARRLTGRGAARAARGPVTLIKICGVTLPDDAARVAAEGADFIGLNFWPASKRYLDPARAPLLAGAARASGAIQIVGVF